MKKIFRHGDLLGIQINSIPTTAKKKSKGKVNILAEGEITGHHHKLTTDAEVELLEDGEELFFTADKEAKLTHEEHNTITVLPATYKVMKEREFDYFQKEMRKVID